MNGFKRIRGDWMTNHQIDNFNRQRVLEVVVTDGKLFEYDDRYGEAHGAPLEITDDGDILISGSVSFCPDPGELDRVLAETK